MSMESLIRRIQPLDQTAMAAAQARQDQLTKPQGSLGRLEALSIQLAGIVGQPRVSIAHKVIVVMAGDHGVVSEGVSAYPSEVTAQMVSNFVQGGAAISVLSRHIGARVVVVDMGVAADLSSHPQLYHCKVAPGTANIATGPAMSRTQAVASIEAGAQVIEKELAQGLDILAVGEMGIGNTTPAAAIAAAYTGQVPQQIVGRGTGINDRTLAVKIDAVQRALDVNQPDPADALDVLAKVGGFEIGGMAGAMLAAAAHRRPVVVDGFISSAAAMIATGLAPQIKDYMISAHRSREQGHKIVLDWLGLAPLLDLEMRLGEGTGAALAMSLAECSLKILNEMATFGQAGVAGKSEQDPTA